MGSKCIYIILTTNYYN